MYRFMEQEKQLAFLLIEVQQRKKKFIRNNKSWGIIKCQLGI